MAQFNPNLYSLESERIIPRIKSMGHAELKYLEGEVQAAVEDYNQRDAEAHRTYAANREMHWENYRRFILEHYNTMLDLGEIRSELGKREAEFRL